MTRQDHINRLKVIKGYCCAQKDQESLDYAIETMRKYQKIEDLVSDCADESVDDTSCCARYIGLIEEIIYTEEQEDGNDD